jgi:hypothetical protein
LADAVATKQLHKTTIAARDHAGRLPIGLTPRIEGHRRPPSLFILSGIASKRQVSNGFRGRLSPAWCRRPLVLPRGPRAPQSRGRRWQPGRARRRAGLATPPCFPQAACCPDRTPESLKEPISNARFHVQRVLQAPPPRRLKATFAFAPCDRVVTPMTPVPRVWKSPCGHFFTQSLLTRSLPARDIVRRSSGPLDPLVSVNGGSSSFC